MFSCGAKPDGFAEAKKLHHDTVVLMNDTSAKLESATTAQQAADTLSAYSAAQKEIAVRGAELAKKYPALKIDDVRTFASDMAEIKVATGRMAKALGTIAVKYTNSDVVSKAYKQVEDVFKNNKF